MPHSEQRTENHCDVPGVSTLMLSALKECRAFNDMAMNYRFHQASMRKLSKLGLAKRRDGDKRKACCWHITDAGREVLRLVRL